MVFARRFAGSQLHLTSLLQTHCVTTASSVVRRCRRSVSRFLFSSTRLAYEGCFEPQHRPPRCARDIRSSLVRDRPRPAQASNGLTDYDPLALRQGSCKIWALQLDPARDDHTRGPCWQVCRPGSLAARRNWRAEILQDTWRGARGSQSASPFDAGTGHSHHRTSPHLIS